MTQLVLAAALVSLTAGDALAEVLVVPDQYVVQEDLGMATAQAVSPQIAAFARPLGRTDGINKSTRLYGLNVARAQASSSDPAYAAYDPAEHQRACGRILAAHPGAVCEPNYVYRAGKTSNDPKAASQWALGKISASSAWNVTTGSESVTVAVIDTGVDYNHADLAANIWQNPGEIAGNSIDDDHNGFVDDWHGVNVYSGGNPSDPFDDNAHGTHCAGIIGAIGDNGTGIAGINWRVKIMPVKFLNASGSGSLFDAQRGIDYAMKNGADIISASWGGGGFSQSMANKITEAQAAGVLFVAAAGNDGLNNDQYPTYPASYTNQNIISVAASNSSDELAYFSNFGVKSVDIAAPGQTIMSTIPGGYANFSGTSMATPYVAGLAALVKAAHPEYTWRELKSAVLNSGDRVSAFGSKMLTGRRINAAAALSVVAEPSEPGETPVAGVKILELHGYKDTNRIYKGRNYSMSLLAPARSSVKLSMRLRNASGHAVARCNLGSVMTSDEGLVDVRGRMKLADSLSRAARSVVFRAGNRPVSRRLYAAPGASSRSTSRAGKVSKADVNRTCAQARSLIRSSQPE